MAKREAEQVARVAVPDHLRATGAHAAYPGLRVVVSVVGVTVTVALEAPLDLPLTLPGSPDRTTVGASGSATVEVERSG